MFTELMEDNMDRFKNSNENPDFYFSTSEGAQANAPVKRSAPHNEKKKKKSSGHLHHTPAADRSDGGRTFLY